MKLRPYQAESKRLLKEALAAGFSRPILTLPTGTGKTVVAADLINDWIASGCRVLFLAHTREIIRQTVKQLEKWIPAKKISIIMRDDPREDFSLPVQVASRQTLVMRDELPEVDVIVIDEAHHAVTDSYQQIIEQYPNALVLGLTATPYRMGGGGLDAVFDTLIIGAKPSKLVADGWMSKARIWSVPDKSLAGTLKKLPKSAGDYQRAELGKVMNKARLVGDIVEHWQRLGKGRPTVCYAVTVEHAKSIVAAFRKARVKAELVTAETPVAERDAMLERLATGATQVIVNCMVLTEGWDCPVAKCIILARPTRSIGLYLQMIGRGLRKGIDCIVLDHAGIALVYGFPHYDREITLEGLVREKGGTAPCKVCPECEAVVLAGLGECPECGHSFDMARKVEEERGHLEELKTREEEMALERERLLKLMKTDPVFEKVVPKFWEKKFGVEWGDATVR